MVRPLRLLLLALAFILLESDILGAALQRHVDLHHSPRDPLDQVGERRRGAGERRRRGRRRDWGRRGMGHVPACAATAQAAISAAAVEPASQRAFIDTPVL